MARFQGHPDPATEPATAEGTDASSGEGATGSPSTAGMPGMEATTESMSERYQDLCILGSGGFGEVRRVYDRKLGRTLAMKLLFPDLGRAEQMRARFLTEIAITARLQHPGIVAVHDAGALADGRLWFTMPEVHGRTLAQVIDESFASAAGGPAAPPGVIRRRLLDIFARVCETAAYVHSRGVIHRDLKPSNIMVGEFGEVLLMDWGIARRLDAGDPAHVSTHGPAHGSAEPLMAEQSLTQHGDVLGTPAYMAPEQARGEVERHGPVSDVYSLGAILYHLLSGRPPFVARSSKAWRRVAGNPPPPLRDAVPPGFDVPAELEAICERALARDPGARYADAGELGAEISAWLAGARRRERALARLQEVAQRAPRIAALRARAEALRIEARRLLADVHPFEPIEAKLPGWEHEDRAQRLDQEAALQETHWQQGIHGVLAIDPDLPDAHDALADHYRAKLAAAERARQPTEAARYEVLLRAHDRGRHTAFLGGHGTLTLVTEPAGAIARLYRYVTHQRRLIPELARELGPTPLVDVPLERGSYLVRLSAPGRIDVSYPVLIERGRHWDGRPPGSAEPYAIPLPRVDEIGAGEVYVPAGWAYTGGDPDAPDGLAETRVWIDGFVIGRFPVTNREYVQFLDDLAARGRHEEAMAACPRANRGTTAQADQELAYGRDAAGRFYLDDSAPGRMGRPDHPAVLMSWHGAMAYARWLAARTGRPYRLPGELEREKAARGVDGRLYPWGDHGDPAWACMLQSHRGDTGHVAVDNYPVDESPYGMRGGAGNSRDWCINPWTLEGPDCSSGRLVVDATVEEAAPTDAYRSVRGGSWSSVVNHCRTAARFAARPDQRRSSTGLRLVRAYP